MKWLCKIGFHKWLVHWYFITGKAECERCGKTGIATPDGVIDQHNSRKEQMIERRQYYRSTEPIRIKVYYQPERSFMKPNEWVLTIVQLAAPIYAFSIGNKPRGIFLTIWLVIFGIAEGISKWQTGGTLSQNVWKQSKSRRIILSLIMIAGMAALHIREQRSK